MVINMGSNPCLSISQLIIKSLASYYAKTSYKILVPPSTKERVKYDMMGGEERGDERSMSNPLIGLHIKYEHPTRPITLSKVWCGWVVGVKRHFRVLLWSKP